MNTISFAPLAPYADGLIRALILVLLPLVVKELIGLLKIKLTDAQYAVIDRTAEKWAAALWAQAEPEIAAASITFNNPEVVKFANLAVEEIPDVLNKLGLSPAAAASKLQTLIAAKIGQMQAQALTVPAQPEAAS
jgi:hypothetical protein